MQHLVQTGQEALDRGDFGTARSHFSQAHLRDPRDPAPRFWLAAAQYHLGQVAPAITHLDALREGPPPLPERPAAVHEYLCRCLCDQDARRAVVVGEEGVQRDPRDGRLRLALGQAHQRAGDAESALRHLDVAWRLEGGPSGAPAVPAQVPYERSSALMALGRWPAALAAADEALGREPDNPVLHNRKGVILFEGLARVEAALTSLRRAVELDSGTSPNSATYLQNLARCLERLGRLDEARVAVDRSLAIAPSPEASALRDRLHAAPRPAAATPPATAPLTFASVGGMHGLKEQVRRIMDILLTRRDEARRYGIVRNGILLYGPPGCGKTFFAEALAGEFGLAFVRVSLASATTTSVGGAAEALERVFREARERQPAVLFLDELDAIATRRDDLASGHERQAVAALLQQLDAHRDVPGLVLVAATNRLEAIDPAVIREGRFDYKVKLYRPDFDARREILDVVLRGRPHDRSVDVSRLAQQMEGFSAAQIRHVVDLAAVAAMHAGTVITGSHLERALEERASDGRWAGPRLGWDDLVLPEATRQRLQFVERFIEHPEVAQELGIEPPSGALLHGPPGTGKTTIARVLASQTNAAFLVVGPADIFSKWLGESEQRIRDLFEQARARVPAIIFIDEIESILGRRHPDEGGGAGRAATAVVNTFLSEMDGIAATPRVFVLGATNRLDLVDEAVLRPGRLGELIEIGLPDADGRLALLRLISRTMRLDERVDLAAVAAGTPGASGADLRGLCAAAGRNALLRLLEAGSDAERVVTADDFARAMAELDPARPPGTE